MNVVLKHWRKYGKYGIWNEKLRISSLSKDSGPLAVIGNAEEWTPAFAASTHQVQGTVAGSTDKAATLAVFDAKFGERAATHACLN